MFGRKKKKQLHPHIDTLIGINTKITGDIHFTGGLRIDGHVTGNVIASDDEHSTLVLSNGGHIQGEIQVANVIINGIVIGPIHAREYLELQEKAKVHGDVQYGSIEIQLGACVEGKMIHQNKPDADHAQQRDKMITLISPAVDQQSISTEKDA